MKLYMNTKFIHPFYMLLSYSGVCVGFEYLLQPLREMYFKKKQKKNTLLYIKQGHIILNGRLACASETVRKITTDRFL